MQKLNIKMPGNSFFQFDRPMIYLSLKFFTSEKHGVRFHSTHHMIPWILHAVL